MDKVFFENFYDACLTYLGRSTKFRIIRHSRGYNELHVESILWFDELHGLMDYIEPQYVSSSLLDGFDTCLSFTFKDHVKA